MLALRDAPLASVIIPAFNAGKTIVRTLKSVSSQTYTNFEVVVVDDGSTDKTAELVAAFAREDRRFRLVRTCNGGVASARNHGLREAVGKYVAPIDADDIWLPENLSRQVAKLEDSDVRVSFCFAGTFIIDEFDARRQPSRPAQTLPSDYVSLLHRNWVGNGSAAVFRREALLQLGGYDETLRLRGAQGAEDWKVILQLAAQHPGVSIADQLIGYRHMPESMSNDPVAMTRSAMLVIDEMQRRGPRLAPWHFWHARTTIHIAMFYPWIYAGHWLGALRCLVRAYIFNPLWFMKKGAREFLFPQLAPHVFGHVRGALLGTNGRPVADRGRPADSA